MKIALAPAVVCVTWAIVMVTAQDLSLTDTPNSCEQNTFTYRGQRKGLFQSPNFPDNYPERTECRYFFYARESGRVKISFDFFDLESSDDDCKYDYLEFSNMKDGTKDGKSTRYCGKSKPPDYISTQPMLLITFFSDVTTNARGFFGHFEFLDSNWNPFPLPTIGCGAGFLTGVGGMINSPNYPSPYPRGADCTWVVSVHETERILLQFIVLDLSSSVKCHEANSLMIFEGFTTADTMPDSYYCGHLDQEPDSKRQYLSRSNRLVIRFQSGADDTGEHAGFQASWTTVAFADSGQCGEQFECADELTTLCDVREKELCNRKHFCIHESLVCNDVSNCGADDRSDENKCLYYILKYVGYIGGPIVAVIILVVVVVFCYKRHCGEKIKYSVPNEQSLSQSATHSILSGTHSSNLHVRSLEHSPRSSCVMYTTAFTDISPGEPGGKCQMGDHAHTNNCNSAIPLPHNTSSFVPPPPENQDEDNMNTYRGHHKRPSYHMMRELCYEDGKIVTANI